MSDMLRITGMATGMDTDGTIKKMMKPYTMRFDKMNQNKQTVQWKQDAYRDVIKDILAFRDNFFNVANGDSNMLSENSYCGYEVVGTSNDVSIQGNSGTEVGNYKVQVEKMARAATIETQGIIEGKDATIKIDVNTKLTDLKTAITGEIKLELKVNGLNKSITLNNTDGTKTIGDLVNAINSQSGGELKAKFSELTGKFSIENNKTGEGNKIILLNDPTSDPLTDPNSVKNLVEGLGLKEKKIGEVVPYIDLVKNKELVGIDAKVNITPPGSTSSILVTKPTNNFTIDGVIYNVTGEGAAETSFTVKNSEEKPLGKVKEFIKKYNELVDKISKKISEKKNYKYQPLSEEQKKDMKEDQITKWEEKGKQGLLRNDETLQSILTSLRDAFFQPVNGSSLKFGKKELGIDTSEYASDGGKLYIKDEAKLKEVLKNNPNGVLDLFTKSGTKKEDMGIMKRLDSLVKENFGPIGLVKGTLVDKAGYVGTSKEFTNILSKDIKDKEKAISEFERKMWDKENSLYMQFAKLEKAMNSMNSQSSWLSQQLGGGR